MGVQDEVSLIIEGKLDEIIAIKGDVLRHIDLLQGVDIVIKHGEPVK